MTQLWELPAAELVAAFRAGTASPVEALDQCLERIAAHDPVVGAFTALAEDRARAEAKGLEAAYRRGDDLGPLAGVPIGVKELFEVTGLPFTGCSATRAGVVGRNDAAAVRLVRDAGAVVVGTTRTHELAWGITTQHESLGSTRNPWRLDRVPGGSSGGSAAAVAYGAVPLALGSDTGGSIRIPAGFCGTVGFKPTFGLVPTDGLLPLAPGFDHAGMLAREVPDAATALGISLGPVPDTLRVGTPRVPAAVPLAPAVASALAAAIDALGGAREVDLPDPAATFAVFGVIQLVQARRAHRQTLGSWPGGADDYGSDVRTRLERASRITFDEYSEARGALDRIRASVPAALEAVDVVVQPCSASGPSPVDTPDEVVHLGERLPLRDAVMPCTVLHDMVGMPACTVPAGLDDDGVPVGIQVTARPGADDLVLGVAAVLRDALRPRLAAWPPIERI